VCGIDSSGSGHRKVPRSCGNSNAHFASIQCRKCLDYLKNCQLLQKGPPAWSSIFCVKNHEDISKARAAYGFRLKSSGLDKHTYREEHEATRNIKSNSKRIFHIKPHMDYNTRVFINKTGNVRIT